MDDIDPPSYDDAMTDYYNQPSAPSLPLRESDPIKSLFRKLTDEEIKEACYKHAEKKFEKDLSNVIKQMKFTNISIGYSLHYKLETFTEKRQVKTGYSHYYKQDIDGPKTGTEPDPWSIPVDIPQELTRRFQEYEEPIIIPHTEHVKTCYQCDGRGKEDCLICEGSGWIYCKACPPSLQNGCDNCKSSLGRLACKTCNETGRIKCRACEGYKKLKHYKELIVTWPTHTDFYVYNSSKVPKDLLHSSGCKEIFREEGPTVNPISNFRQQFFIQSVSSQYIEKHKTVHGKDEAIRMQRQTLRAVPISTVSYEYKYTEGEFYVFGLERSVYFLNDLSTSSSCCIS